MAIRIFSWPNENGGNSWYGTQNGKAIAGPHPDSGGVVLELERKGFRRFRERPPPPSWYRGTAGPEKAPQPFKKVMEVVVKASGVAAVVGAVTGHPEVAAIAATVGKIAEALAELNLADLKKALEEVDAKDVLDTLLTIENAGKNRDGAKAAIKARRKALRAMRGM